MQKLCTPHGWPIQTTTRIFLAQLYESSSFNLLYNKFYSLISPNLLRLITCTAIANGGQREWDHGYEKYKNSTLVNEKNDLLRAITCSRDPVIINK